MSDRYFADLDIHGEVIRFYPDDGKTRLHQNDARRIPVESVAFVRERAIAEAVAAERERNDATIRSLATGYERMRRALCNMTATSGPDASWYRHQADQALYSVPAIWDIAQNPVEAQPGECSWINRDGSLEAIRSAVK